MQNNLDKELNEEYLLEVNNLKMHFDITTGFFKTTPLKAVDGVSFKIKKGETLGVVGESGCGKTTLGRTIMNLYNPSSGDVLFDGVEISPYSDLKKIVKEKQFEIKSAKYEAKKKIKALSKDDVEKIETIKKELDETVNNLTLKYQEKYSKKQAEINGKLAEIEALKNSKLESIAVKEKNPTVEADVDKKVSEFKTTAKTSILSAKEHRNPLLKKALEDKKNALAEQKKIHQDNLIKVDELNKANKEKLNLEKQKVSEITDNEELTLAKTNYKNLKAKLNKDYEKIKKDAIISNIVAKEKIQNDYSVEKSKITGEYQNTLNVIKEDLALQIKKARSESEYYTYIDSIKEIKKQAANDRKAVLSSSKIRMKDFRKKCTMVFQDPYSSLNPRMTVADIIAEPLDVNKLYKTKEERRSIVLDLMKKVGLSPEQSTRYAHEFSGGQRQRIGIARALAVNPKFIVCDEPVSALDVSIQAQVINTFEDLQKDLGLTYLFIAHDLLVVRHISDRIAVMYLGKVVELAETDELYETPLHPYTISLLSAVPLPDPKKARENKRIILEGDVPSPLNVPSGCPFRTRCPRACERCRNEVPTLKEVKPGHFVSCLLVQEELEKNS